jgi:hypothetical protein
VLAAGCREADVLITDSQHLAKLPALWQDGVKKTMRNPQILVLDVTTSQFRKL